MASNVHTVRIVAAPIGGYPIPSSGQVLDVPLAGAILNSIRPANYTARQWQYTLVDSYGGGGFAPNYGTQGGFVFASQGGHKANEFIDAVVWVVSTGTWAHLANANGLTARPGPYSGTVGVDVVDKGPACEMVGANPPQIPAPVHQYLNSVVIPPAWGGGTFGSIVSLGGAPTEMGTVTGGYNKRYPHKMNLQTRLWTRINSTSLYYQAQYGAAWGSAVVDHVNGRLFQFGDSLHSSNRSLRYINLANNQYVTVTFTGSLVWGNANHASPFIDFQRNLLLVRVQQETIWAIPLNNLTAGPKALTVNHTAGFPPGAYHQRRFQYYPPQDCFYLYGGSSNILWKLTPPASGDPLTGTWTTSTRTLSSTPRPEYNTTANGGIGMNRLFYIPQHQCFGWVADTSVPVQLIKP